MLPSFEQLLARCSNFGAVQGSLTPTVELASGTIDATMCSMSAPSMQLDRRTVLWDSMLDAELNVYYWGYVSARYTDLDKYLKIIIAVAASGTVAGWSIWSQHPGAWKFFSAIACLASVIHPYICSSDVLKRTSELVATWKEVFVDYELLWHEDGVLQSEKSWNEFEGIKRRESHIDETRLPRWKGLLEKAFRRVLAKRRLA